MDPTFERWNGASPGPVVCSFCFGGALPAHGRTDAGSGHEAARINYDPSRFLLQQLDYCGFIELYGGRIASFHVKDAEFSPNGRVGVYGGCQGWARRRSDARAAYARSARWSFSWRRISKTLARERGSR